MAILERDLSVPGNCSFDVEFDGDILVVKTVYDDEQYESVDTTFDPKESRALYEFLKAKFEQFNLESKPILDWEPPAKRVDW